MIYDIENNYKNLKLIHNDLIHLEFIYKCIKKEINKNKSIKEIKEYYNSKKIPNINPIINDILNIPKNEFIFRYGQEEAYNNFKRMLELNNYWGLMIAPTGWGKSMMHYLFMGYFFKKSNKNILLITKRKDILSDVIKEIEEEILKLKESNMFPDIEIKILDQVNEKLDYKKINKNSKYTIIITNSDKLITRNKDDDNFNSKKLDNIKFGNFGLVLFDEVHWAGSKRNVQFMEYLKNKIPYGVGSSATPIRKSLDNQANIQKIYGDNYDIMYELTYMDAWDNNVILKVDTILFPIYNKSINKDGEIKNQSKKIIIEKINDILNKSYKKKAIIFFNSRMSLLLWYSFFQNYNYFNELSYHTSFTYSNNLSEQKNNKLEKEIIKKIKKLDINTNDIDNGISNFKKELNNAILLVVGRANEGFNDPLVDICVNLDFSKNSSMLLTLQKMGRTQRVNGTKEKGYYICPIISENNSEFQNIIAQNLHDYIKTTSDNSIKYKYSKSIPSNLMKEIIETFKVEGINNYTHDDIMKRIRQLEKEKAMTLEQFLENLKTYKITNHDDYYNMWLKDESFRELGMPRFYDSIDRFSWNLVNNDNYYNENEIIDIIKNIYENNLELFDDLIDHDDILDTLHELDNKIPKQYPWTYYNISKHSLSYIFN